MTPPLISVRDVQYTEVVGGYHVIVTTDIPSHLFMRWTLTKPQIHSMPVLRRGLMMHADKYFCFTAYHDNEQEEAGDTLTHTFIKVPWPCCQTRYFYFWGSVAGVTSNSTTAFFTLHSTVEGLLTFDALGTCGYVYANENSYSAARDKWTGTVVTDSNLCTIGQAKEGVEGFYIWRGGLFFDTFSLPSSGAILDAKILFDVIHGGIFSAIHDPDQCLTIIHYPWGLDPPIQPHHYGYMGLLVQDHGHICKNDWLAAAPDIAKIQLNRHGLNRITRGGLTKFGMRGSHDINNIPDVGFIERNRFDFSSPRLDETGKLWLNITYSCKPPQWAWYEPWGTTLTLNHNWIESGFLFGSHTSLVTCEMTIFNDGQHAINVYYDPPPTLLPLIDNQGRHLMLHYSSPNASFHPTDGWLSYIFRTRNNGDEFILEPVIYRGTLWGPPGTYEAAWDNAFAKDIAPVSGILDLTAFWSYGRTFAGKDPNPAGWYIHRLHITNEQFATAVVQTHTNDYLGLKYKVS